MSTNLSENEIDKLVIAQADDDDAWGKPIIVNKKPAFSLDSPVPEVVSDKNVLNGTPVFRGTQVPVSTLLENLENGITVDQFVKNFPSVKREQAVSVLEFFKNTIARLNVAQ